MNPDGSVGGGSWYVTSSYGLGSPESNFGSIDYVWYITSDGIANNGMFTITGSYGRSPLDSSDNKTVYIVNPQGRADYYGPGISVNVKVTYSYGNIFFYIEIKKDINFTH